MGGLILIASVVAVYVIIFWSILIELYYNKRIGFLKFSEDASGTLKSDKKQKKILQTSSKPYLNTKYIENKPSTLTTSSLKKIKKDILKSDVKNYKTKSAKKSYLKK